MGEGCEEKRSSTGRVIVVIAVLIGLPMLYVLSVGPVGFIVERAGAGDSVEPALVVVYTPVRWLYGNSGLFRKFMHSYLRLWGLGPCPDE